MKKIWIICLASMLLLACNRKPSLTYGDYVVDVEETIDDNVVAIPFTVENGVKYLDVTLNGMGVQMVFDPGCSTALISLAEAQYLYEKGALTLDDYMGSATSKIADGSIVEDMVFNLREVVLDDQLVCYNVQATVSSNTNAPLLLGNDVFDRVASYTVDNENSRILFTVE